MHVPSHSARLKVGMPTVSLAEVTVARSVPGFVPAHVSLSCIQYQVPDPRNDRRGVVPAGDIRGCILSQRFPQLWIVVKFQKPDGHLFDSQIGHGEAAATS